MLTRRTLIRASTLALSVPAGSLLSGAFAPDAAVGQQRGARRSTVQTHEITMAAPDIVCLEFRDASFTRGRIEKLESVPASSKQGDWIEWNGTWGRVLGPGKAHIRTGDRPPEMWIDIAAIDQKGWEPIGGQAVTAVYRKSVPYDSGIFRGDDGETVKGAAFKHFIYLKLAGRLAPGDHRVALASGDVDTTFSFSDSTTRAIAIRANQHGHRPGDAMKIGYLALWLPGGKDHGAFSFKDYGLKTFEVIDQTGRTVFEGPIVERVGPKVLEPSEPQLLTYQYADSSTYQANRSGTFVYGLDYSGWQNAAEGTYRLKIAGLGVSDPFVVSQSAWYQAARISLTGLYHHRSGIALDGRFGYARPIDHRPGINAPVYNSRLPFLFSHESGLGIISFEQGAAPAWITATENADAWGGHMDAGDWDRRIQHLEITTGLLLIFEILPASSRDVSWGLPKNSEILDRTLYQEMDDLPDILHEAAFALDIYRRMQDVKSGAIRGGVEAGGGPVHGEPSFLDSQKQFAYAPDHRSGWLYAAAAARFARTMTLLKKERLARVYRKSAEAAFAWSERAHADLDAAYAEAVAIAQGQGAFRGQSWSAYKKRIISNTKTARASAAAALYRLTGATAYRSVFEAIYDSGLSNLEHGGDAQWDYAKATAKGARFDRTAMLDQFVATTRRYVLSGQGRRTNFKSTKWRGLPMQWGQGNAPDYNQIQLLLRSYDHSRDPIFLKCMQAAMSHILGANQPGICMTTGLGHRTVRHPLHEDHMSMGVDVPSGITLYGYGPWQATDYEWVWGNNSWAVMPPQSSRFAKRTGTSGFRRRSVHPFRRSLPLFEYFIEHPLIIMQQEYTVQQTINTTAMMALFLHGHDGNNKTSYP